MVHYFQVVLRILEQWQALQTFFNAKWLAERLVATECIHRDLNDPFVKMFFFFLEWALPKVVGVNEYFQSDKFVITHVDGKMKNMYTELLLGYMSREHVNRVKLERINPLDQSMFLPLNQIYIGVKISRQLQNPVIAKQKREVEDFLCRCREFLITVCKQIKERYDLSDQNLFSKVAWLNPEIAVSSTDPKRLRSLEPLITEVARIVSPEGLNFIRAIDDQWRKLPQEVTCKNWVLYPPSEAISMDSFWFKVRETETLDGKKDYKEIGQFSLDIFALPHSSASCERVFSKVHRVKTDYRNRLLTNTLQGVLSTSECVSKIGCDKFQPTERMLSYMTASNIYGPKMSRKEKLKTKQATDVPQSESGNLESDEEVMRIEFDGESL